MKISVTLFSGLLSAAFGIDWIGMHGKMVEDDLCDGLSDQLQYRLCSKFSKDRRTKGFMEAIHTATIQTTTACSVSTIKGRPFSSNIVRGFARRLSYNPIFFATAGFIPSNTCLFCLNGNSPFSILKFREFRQFSRIKLGFRECMRPHKAQDKHCVSSRLRGENS